MIGRALQNHLGAASLNPYEVSEFAYIDPSIPLVNLQHDGLPHLKTKQELETNKSRFRGTKVILLSRDPRDMVVSWYFEKSRRGHLPGAGEQSYDGDMSAFLRADCGSLDTIIAYLNIWAENRRLPDAFLLVRYEDLLTDPAGELRRIFDFLGVEGISDRALTEAAEFASFGNMRKMEEENALNIPAFAPGNAADPSSFKTRIGKAGSYMDSLTPEDIAFVDGRVVPALSDFFGYSVGGRSRP